MTITMHEASVPTFGQMLEALSEVLAKAAAHAAERGFDEAVLVQSRLYPDMLPLASQVRIACDTAKFCVARLAGVEAPKHADDETTIAQLRERIASTLAFVRSVPRASVDGSEDRTITIPLRSGPLAMRGLDYLRHFAAPNVVFHVTTAYGILRHNGVPLGKRDFLGAFPTA